MAYRADFYIPENIIGYTGSLHKNPTVYFLTDDEFGHITQSHRRADNVGREAVGSRNDLPGYTYVMRNETNSKGEEVMFEGYVNANNPDGPFEGGPHQSRNKFISTQRANINVFAILAQAI